MNKYIPTKEELTNHQLGPVLAVIRELTPFLLEDVVEPGGTPTARALTGEVTLAASTTFIKACSRIDTILDDESRFSMKAHTDVMTELVKTYKLQQKFIIAQTESTEMLRKPHFVLRPTVVPMGDSQYVAYWGDLSKAGQAICGVGNTPNAAFSDFDKAFDRAPKEQIVLIAEQAGIDLNLPKIPPTE